MKTEQYVLNYLQLIFMFAIFSLVLQDKVLLFLFLLCCLNANPESACPKQSFLLNFISCFVAISANIELMNTRCLFSVEEKRHLFGKREVDVIQGNFIISVQRHLNLIKCWLMNTLKNVYRNSASHSWLL